VITARLFAIFVALVVLSIVTSPAMSSQCKKSSSACLDATPCKSISGDTVCLSSMGLSCWQYQDTYECVDPNSVNYCSALSNAGCAQTGTSCNSYAFNGSCLAYTNTYRCASGFTQPASTIKLDDTYTLVSSGYDQAQCASQDGSQNCALAESVCTSTTPPSLPPGITPAQVAPDGCYQRENKYACLTGAANTSECDGYASNPNCTLQSTAPCDAEDMIGGQCSHQRQSYRCVSKPPQTSTVTDCAGQQFCQGGNCFDKGYENDPDFARSMALMEAAREAGVYGDTTSIFSGVASSCTVNQFGLSNCCKKSGGGQSNSAVMGVATQVGSQTFNYGSAYAYDALFSTSAPNWVVNGLGSMAGASASYGPGLAASSFSPTLSLYGFTATTGTLGAGVSSLGSFGGVTFGFDPYSLAFSVAIMIIQDMLACEPEEQILSMKLGQNLCHEVGNYCSNKFLGKCITKTRAHCCYNSRLARIINEQGRVQIGKSWGAAQSPNCSGFTADEFALIDFSTVDLSEFVSEIMASVKMPNISGMSQDVQGSVQTKMQNYYQR